jgi:hypothetical protein
MLTLEQAQTALENRQGFTAGNLSTRYDLSGNYSVYSYLTLIAYETNGGEMVILENAYDHSQTTSKHANIVKKAWGI